MASYHNKLTDSLMSAICKLKTKEECYDFFDDVCTIKEVLDMSSRLEAAKLLNLNKNYKEIIKEIGLSTATLARVNKALKYGSGYKKVLGNNK